MVLHQWKAVSGSYVYVHVSTCICAHTCDLLCQSLGISYCLSGTGFSRWPGTSPSRLSQTLSKHPGSLLASAFHLAISGMISMAISRLALSIRFRSSGVWSKLFNHPAIFSGPASVFFLGDDKVTENTGSNP